MSAPVRLEASVWSDTRFDLLARLSGYTRYDCVARMARLWADLTNRETGSGFRLQAEVVFEHADAMQWLLQCDLALPVEGDPDAFTVRGSSRLGWLAKARKSGRENGKKGGRPKTGSGSTSKPEPVSKNNPSSSSSSSSSSSQEELTLSCAPVGAPRFDFEGAYKLYPKKKGKAEGLERLKKLCTTQVDFELLRLACQRMGDSWRGHDLEYCPMFSTFVSKKRWRDEQLPLPKSSGPTGESNPFKR